MGARELFFVVVALSLVMWVAGRRGGWLGRRAPKREHRETLEEQIESDFPPIYHDEVKMLVESVLTYARPDDREMVWRRVLDAARCDIDRLRKLAPGAGESLRKVYRLFGDTGGRSGAGGAADDAART